MRAIFARRARADRGYRSSVKIIFEDDDLGAVFRNSLGNVAPAARQFDRRLDGLHAGIHRHGFIETADSRKLLQKNRQPVVAHRSRRQGHALRLLDERGINAGMAMPNVHRGVRADAVEIPLARNVPEPDALGPFDHEVERSVIPGAVPLLFGD